VSVGAGADKAPALLTLHFWEFKTMIRSLSIATVLAATLALPAMAEDAKTQIEPGTGPTSTMTDEVPQMKRDAQAIEEAGPNPDKPLPSSKAVGDAVPSMRPGDAASGADEKSGTTTAGTSQPQGADMSLTEQEALTWIDKPVFSSDGEQVGEVVAIQRDPDNKVTGLHADIGGFLGLGETRVNLMPAQFKLQSDRVELNLTAEQAKSLPKVQI
jgi:hypothetical protein